MWNRLKAAAAVASNAVQALDDLLNQADADPLEELQYYWKSVQNEHNEIVEMQALAHASENTDLKEGEKLQKVDTLEPVSCRKDLADDVSVLRNSNIKENLEQLVTILRDEEQEDTGPGSPRTSNGAVRPCLSYMLEHHLIEILCAMALADQPRGMMALVLQVIKLMLHHIHQPLIPHERVHRPINHLIHVCMEARYAHNSSSTMVNGGHKASYRMQTSLIGLLAEIWYDFMWNFSSFFKIFILHCLAFY